MPSDTLDICDEASTPVANMKRSKLGLTILGLTSGALVGLVVAAAPFVTPALRRYCLPFVPATEEQVQNVLSVLPRKGRLADIGSGDGRIVIAAAQKGLKSTGYELNPWLVLYSKFRSYRLGLGTSATFVKQDLWKTDFNQYNYVVIFGVTQMMTRLEEKLSKELQPGSYVVACRFPFPTWEPVKTIGGGIDTVWLYNAPKPLRS